MRIRGQPTPENWPRGYPDADTVVLFIRAEANRQYSRGRFFPNPTGGVPSRLYEGTETQNTPCKSQSGDLEPWEQCLCFVEAENRLLLFVSFHLARRHLS